MPARNNTAPDPDQVIKAAKFLDGIAVTAYRSDGTVENTTFAKAVGMDDLVKAADDRRAEWRKALETVDAALAKAPYIAGGPLAKQQAMERLAKADPVANFGRMVRAYQQEVRDDRLKNRIVRMAKSELVRRNTAKTLAKSAKLARKTEQLTYETELSKARVAEAQRLVAEAVQTQVDATARVEAFTLDARVRIDAMMKRLEAGQRVQRLAPVIAERAAHDQRRAAWQEKALLATDPILKQGYQNLADGNDED